MSEKTKIRTKEAMPKTFEVKEALVTVELGRTDAPVLRYLDFLARQLRFGAFHLLHVRPLFDTFRGLYERETGRPWDSLAMNEQILEQMRLEARQFLGENGLKSKVDYEVREGDCLEEVLRAVQERRPDLVVVGQKSDLSLHGTLARQLVRKTRCHALVIPEKARTELRHILVPVDFSPNSLRALQTALALHRALERPAAITALNVYELPSFSTYKIDRSPERFKAMMMAEREAAFRDLLKNHFPEEAADIRIQIVEKDLPGIGHYIMDVARETPVDFIVMGAKGHSRVELLLMGSVTEKVLSLNDSIPTLVVR